MLYRLLLLFCSCSIVMANDVYQKNQSMGKAETIKALDHGVEIKTAEGTLIATVYSPTIIKVHFTKKNRLSDTLSYAKRPEFLPSKAFKATESSDAYRMETDSLILSISKNPVRIRFTTKSGILINEDESAFGTSWIGEEVTTYKRLISDEKFIGMGEKTGGLNRRGEGFTHWNTDYFGYPTNADPIYMSTPFYIGLHESQGAKVMYGIFMDNSYKSHFNFGASNDRFASFTAEYGVLFHLSYHRSRHH